MMGVRLYSPAGTHSLLLCETDVGGVRMEKSSQGCTLHSKAGTEKKKAPDRANTNTA